MSKTELLKRLKGMPLTGWTCRHEKTGRGDYGKRETYLHCGNPIYQLEIDYTTGGKCEAKWLADWLNP
jgi:hypothetical protein